MAVDNSPQNSPQNLPVAVLLDSNQWYGDPMLKSADAAVLLYRLQQLGGRLALPEVVESEIEANLHKAAEDYEGSIPFTRFKRLGQKRFSGCERWRSQQALLYKISRAGGRFGHGRQSRGCL